MNEKKKLRRLPKRILSFVLTLVMMLTLMPGMTMTVNAATLTADEVMTKIDASANLLEGNIGGVNYTLSEAYSAMGMSSISDFIAYFENMLRDAAVFNSSEAPKYKWTLDNGDDTVDLLIVELNGNGVVIYAYLVEVGEFTYTPPTHEHDWKYSATGNKLEAYCATEGCDNYAASYEDAKTGNKLVALTLTATSQNYSGSAVEATMDTTAWEAAGLTAPPIDYEAKNGSALTDGKAVNVGSYTAKIKVDGKTASKDFEITSASSNKSSFKEPEKVFVDLDTNKSEVAYGTVFMHNKDNVRNIVDMKVHSVDARTKANQEFLAASYAKNQGKRARVLLTTGIYSRNKLAAKDMGAKKFISFINLEKKIMPVYAVCYNQTDKAYYLTGTMNANGTAVFNDFIANEATNITIFVLE